MQYSFNRDYSSLSGTNIPYKILNSNYKNVVSSTTPASANFIYTGDLGGIRVIPEFSLAHNFISDTDFFVDFGDGTIVENNLSAFHKYSTPGNYPITLVVSSSAGFLFKALRNYVVNVIDPVPDKIFLTQNTQSQYESEGTVEFYITRFNSLNTSKDLSANDYSIKLSVDGNISPLQFENEYLDNENFQYQNKSFFFTSPDEKFEVIEKVKTSNTFIYGKISNRNNLVLSTLSAADNQLVGTSGFGTFRYFEPIFSFPRKFNDFGYTLNLSGNIQSVNEGGTALISLSTTALPDGLQIPYTITDTSTNATSEFSPNITPQDLSTGALPATGFFTILNNRASLTINPNEDVFIEGNESIRITLNNTQDFYDLIITDTTRLSTINYASTFINSIVPGWQDPKPTTQTYASTLSNFNVVNNLIPRYASTLLNTNSVSGFIPRYASTLPNTNSDTGFIPRYASTIANTHLDTGFIPRYASTLPNTNSDTGFIPRYASTLPNTSESSSIVETYALTLNNTNVIPGPPAEGYALTLKNTFNRSTIPKLTTTYASTLSNFMAAGTTS